MIFQGRAYRTHPDNATRNGASAPLVRINRNGLSYDQTSARANSGAPVGEIDYGGSVLYTLQVRIDAEIGGILKCIRSDRR